MNLLITGGAGFIGSNFIRLVLNSIPECKIVNLDKLTYAGNLDNLKDVENHPNYTFIKGDICDRKILEDIMSGIDAVVHFAAETHVDKSIKDAGIFIDTDVKGTYLLLGASHRHNVKRFIHISTDEVYGSIRSGLFTEESCLRPNSPYSASKAAADVIARAYHKTYDFPIIITRSCNNYGPRQFE